MHLNNVDKLVSCSQAANELGRLLKTRLQLQLPRRTDRNILAVFAAALKCC